MTKTDIQRLAAAVNALRPDWPTKSLVTFIANNLGSRATLDASVAMAWIAADPKTKTPARVLEAGPWWKATRPQGAPTGEQPAAKDSADRCKICGHTRAGHDHLAAITDDHHPWTTPEQWRAVPVHQADSPRQADRMRPESSRLPRTAHLDGSTNSEPNSNDATEENR